MSSISHRKELESIVNQYLGIFPAEGKQLSRLLTQLSSPASPLDRSTLPGHITASGIVVNENKILMIFHPFVEKWLQPGGHIDAGENPGQAAIRETMEETGFKTELHAWHASHACPFDIDIHKIPANAKKNEPEHYHYDFRYLLTTDAVRLACAEKIKFEWRPWQCVKEPHLSRVKYKLQGLFPQGVQ